MAQAACPDGVQVAFMPTLGAATEEMQILGSRGLKGQVHTLALCPLGSAAFAGRPPPPWGGETLESGGDA